MNIKSVHIGTWFQRTDLHLRELYNFFTTDNDLQGLNNEKLKELKGNFGNFKIEFDEGLVNYLTLNLEHKVDAQITEDGVVLLSKTFENAQTDIEKLKHQYENVLSPTINYLFSRGAPLPKELANIKLVFPYYFVGTDINENNAQSILKDFDDKIISTVKGSRITLFIGSIGTILSFKNDIDAKNAQDIIKYGVFFREFETQLQHYLELHRTIWEEMDTIRSQETLSRSDFPKLRNKLMERKKFLSFVSARLNQMEHLLSERENFAETLKLRDELSEISWNSFASLAATHKYIQDLWSMTKEYVDSTVELLQIFYQENTQRELVALEIISLFNTIIGLVNFFKSVAVIDLLVIIVSSATFYVTLKYIIRGRKFTLPKN